MTKPQLIHHKVRLTKNNAKKLAKGENTLLKHEQILDGEHDLFLTPVQSTKLMRNARQGKGVKLHLSPGELDHSLKKGKGLSDLLSRGYKAVRPRLRRALHTGIDKYAPRLEAEVERRVKAVTRRVKPAIHKGIDLALGPDETVEGGKLSWKGFKRGFAREYKQHVKPIVAPIIRQGLKTAIKTGLPALAVMSGQPQLAPMAGVIADKYGDQGIDALGKATGAFGLKKGRRGRVAKKAPPKAVAKTTVEGVYFSNMLPLDHPALNPGDTRLKNGGSFLAAGGRGFKPAGH